MEIKVHDECVEIMNRLTTHDEGKTGHVQQIRWGEHNARCLWRSEVTGHTYAVVVGLVR